MQDNVFIMEAKITKKKVKPQTKKKNKKQWNRQLKDIRDTQAKQK